MAAEFIRFLSLSLSPSLVLLTLRPSADVPCFYHCFIYNPILLSFSCIFLLQTNEASSNVMEEISTYDHSEFFIEITVSEPQKMGEGIGSHLVYKYVLENSTIELSPHPSFHYFLLLGDFGNGKTQTINLCSLAISCYSLSKGSFLLWLVSWERFHFKLTF